MGVAKSIAARHAARVPHTAKNIAGLKRVGGHPVLDFVNTVNHWIDAGTQCDYLGDYAGLLRWSREVGLLGQRETREIARAAQERPDAAAGVFRDALVLRRALHEIMLGAIAKRAANPDDARLIDTWYRRAARARGTRIDRDGKLHVGWQFDQGEQPFTLPLLQLVWSAVEFLLTVEPGRLKECPPDQGCGWVFHDVSKNRSRRWCDMSDCGNAAKARRHYARVRKVRDAAKRS
jgi:predicted RNA-binding Zn ribbon-like protein